MPHVLASPPPGLEEPLAVKPVLHDIQHRASPDQSSLLLEPDGHHVFEYSTEVPFLRQQITELTSKVMELASRVAVLESQKMQSVGPVLDLRGQPQPFQCNAREESLVPMRASTFKSNVFEVGAPPSRIFNVPPSVPVPQGFDNETSLKVYKSCRSMATDHDGLQIIVETMRMEWTIKHFTAKLRSAMGRPLVSSPFALWDLDEIRLMITPEVQEGDSGPRGRSRKEKEQFSKMLTNGPFDAGLSLKVPYARPCLLKYYFGVGTKESCPLECDFSTTAIDNRSGTFLGIDWLLETDMVSSITVSVEMLAPT